MDNALQPLLQPVQVGPYRLPNRIVMAPMTRARATNPDCAATDLHAAYYAQRAGAGLIVTEGSQISPEGTGWANTPGIHSEAQVAGWARVTAAVHARGGHIFLQLWHVGRVSHPDFQGGALPVGPSAVNADGKCLTPTGMQDTVTPRALATAEVSRVIGEHARAAANALRAGFDGVELQAGDGWLVEQFLRDSANRRTDRYGGSIANRVRFLLETVDAIVSVTGGTRLGVRLTPVDAFRNPPDSHTADLYDHVVAELSTRGLAYLHLVESAEGSVPLNAAHESVITRYRARYRGTLIANKGYGRESANALVAGGAADLVSFGKLFVANPDLPERFRVGAPLADLDRATLYGGGAAGYTDYPALDRPRVRGDA